MHFAGIPLPPLGSVQDSVLRRAFLLQRARQLKEVTMSLLAQGGRTDPVYDMFRGYSEDMLYSEHIRKAEEKSLHDTYKEIQEQRPVLSKGKDGKLVVTGI